jgi:hypothetical protein
MASDLSIRAFYEKVCAEALPKTSLFGISLDKYMELQKKSLPFMNEPWIVRKCCDFLRDNGAETALQSWTSIYQLLPPYTDTLCPVARFLSPLYRSQD